MPRMPKPRSRLERMVDDLANGGGKLQIIDYDEIITCDFVICVLAEAGTVLPDNVFDFCCGCQRKVQLRPHVPPGPKRICYDCARKSKLSGNPAISQRTASEIAARRRRH